ncbi:MAG TPA: hypothetical protein DCR21_01910 [Succinivibrionaceae bacterium]|nr:hypothetical protein [Succinivibrionaceae bacterium]
MSIMLKKILITSVLCAAVSLPSYASLRLDVKNDTSEDCSLAINARTDKTKWVTIGWYVYSSGEEAPIILDKVSDIHNVYVYNDCTSGRIPKDAETKKVWVKIDRQFYDEVPREHEPGYEEVVFERLKSPNYEMVN